MVGIVKDYDKERGFGFITSSEGETIFFHYTQIIMEGYKGIEAGTQVDFERVETDLGIQAHNVMRL